MPLRKKGDFQTVFERGHKFSSRYIVIYTKPNGLRCCRLGMAVSRKVGKAVIRNRLRRRIREAVRKEIGDTSFHYDIVIVARMYAAEASFSDLKHTIGKCLSRLVYESNSYNTGKTL